MAANTSPIYLLTPNIVITAVVTGANTATDGTGTTTLCFTGGTNGSRLDGINFQALGTNAATVARVFVNNGSTPATATNNNMIGDFPMAATTASNSTAIGPSFYWPNSLAANKFIPSAYRVYVCYGTAPTGGIVATADGGDF